jgi:hypothetical protein
MSDGLSVVLAEIMLRGIHLGTSIQAIIFNRVV